MVRTIILKTKKLSDFLYFYALPYLRPAILIIFLNWSEKMVGFICCMGVRLNRYPGQNSTSGTDLLAEERRGLGGLPAAFGGDSREKERKGRSSWIPEAVCRAAGARPGPGRRPGSDQTKTY